MTLVPDADVLVTIQRSGHVADIIALGELPVVITDSVWDEVTVGAQQSGAHSSSVLEMRQMLISMAKGPTMIVPQSAEAKALAVLQTAPPSEGPGELSVIAFAFHHPEAVPILIDRRALRRAVEELRRTVLSLHGFLDVLRTEHGLLSTTADDISSWYCKKNTPVRRPVWW